MKFSVLALAAASGLAVALPGKMAQSEERNVNGWKDLTDLKYSQEIPVAKVNLQRRKSNVPVKDNRDLVYSSNLPLARERGSE
jgi:predicted DNA binding CopG/RHH family protein